MSDNGKNPGLEAISAALLIMGCVIAFSVAFTAINSLALPIFGLTIGAALFMRHLPGIEQRQVQFGYHRRDVIGLGLAAASMATTWFFANMNNLNLVLVFAAVTMVIIALVEINKARQVAGRIRLYYIGSVLWFDGLILAGFGYKLPFSDEAEPWLSAIGGILFFIGLFLALANEKVTKQYWQRQPNQPQLDTAKGEPFYTEQLKPDKVKEQG